MSPDIKQTMQALDRANQVRFKGKAVKDKIRAGDLSIRKALDHPDAQAIRLNDLLEAQWRWGEGRVHRLMVKRLNMGPTTQFLRVRELTDRQKKLIAQGVADPDFWIMDRTGFSGG